MPTSQELVGEKKGKIRKAVCNHIMNAILMSLSQWRQNVKLAAAIETVKDLVCHFAHADEMTLESHIAYYT